MLLLAVVFQNCEGDVYLPGPKGDPQAPFMAHHYSVGSALMPTNPTPIFSPSRHDQPSSNTPLPKSQFALPFSTNSGSAAQNFKKRAAHGLSFCFPISGYPYFTQPFSPPIISARSPLVPCLNSKEHGMGCAWEQSHKSLTSIPSWFCSKTASTSRRESWPCNLLLVGSFLRTMMRCGLFSRRPHRWCLSSSFAWSRRANVPTSNLARSIAGSHHARVDTCTARGLQRNF